MPLFECVGCSRRLESDALDPRCAGCGSALLSLSSPAEAAAPPPSREELDALPPGVWRFRRFLPRVDEEYVVSLGEGGTPLLQAGRLGGELGFGRLLIKDETRNPTGSFIDRGSTVLMSLAMQRGVRRISCVTTGNLGASLAAYSAKAGMEAEIGILPDTDHGKLYQMIAYGARVEILSRPPRGARPEAGTLAVSASNPYVVEGEKSTALEIVQDLAWSRPDAIVVPVGTGGHLTMIWRGLRELEEAGLLEPSSCRLIGVQLQAPAAADEKPLTELEEPDPAFRRSAVEAMRESGGCGLEIPAREAIHGTSLLARTEGIFAEPASASVVASLRLIRDNGILDPGDRVVCVVTGSGLKDTRAIKPISRTPKPIVARDDPLVKPVQMGATKLRILRALRDQPRFGYGLWKLLSEERRMTTASVYQHLAELEGIALVRRSGVARVKGRERLLYEITGRGLEFLRLTELREERFGAG